MTERTMESILEQVAARLWGRAVVEMFVEQGLRDAVAAHAAGDLGAFAYRARFAADIAATLPAQEE